MTLQIIRIKLITYIIQDLNSFFNNLAKLDESDKNDKL